MGFVEEKNCTYIKKEVVFNAFYRCIRRVARFGFDV